MSILNGSEPKVRAFADNTILLLMARLMAAFGPPIALGLLFWMFHTVDDYGKQMIAATSAIADNKAQIAHLDVKTDKLQDNQIAIGNRVTALEAIEPIRR